MSIAECVVDCRDHLGEGIFWDEKEQALYWLDVPMPSKLHRWDPESREHQVWDMLEMISSMSVREKGGVLIASHHGLNHFDFDQSINNQLGLFECCKQCLRSPVIRL